MRGKLPISCPLEFESFWREDSLRAFSFATLSHFKQNSRGDSLFISLPGGVNPSLLLRRLQFLLEMWLHTFYAVALSSIGMHIFAVITCLFTLMKHSKGRWYSILLIINAVFFPLIVGLISSGGSLSFFSVLDIWNFSHHSWSLFCPWLVNGVVCSHHLGNGTSKFTLKIWANNNYSPFRRFYFSSCPCADCYAHYESLSIVYSSTICSIIKL